MAITVTATQGGTGTENGVTLTVKVLTGAASTQNGATGTDGTTLTVPQKSITPGSTGSVIYGAVSDQGSSTVPGINGTSTSFQAISDATNGAGRGNYRVTATTTAATPVTAGYSSPTGQTAGSVNWCAAEIKASGTLAEDASSPAGVNTNAAKTVSTASFTPPGGSLLVAMVSCDYLGSGTLTMTVSDGTLTWTQLVGATVDLASVWIAAVPVTGSAAVAGAGSVTANAVFTTMATAAVAGAGAVTAAAQSTPSAVTLPVSGLTLVTYTSTNATLNGSVSPNGLSATWSFDWGQTPSYGYSAAGGTVAAPGPVAVTLTGLPGGMELHYRIRATSSLGTALGADQDFICAARQPGPILPPSSPAGNPGTQA